MRYIYFLIVFNNVLRLTPRPASRLTLREAKGKRLDIRFRLFKPCQEREPSFWISVTVYTGWRVGSGLMLSVGLESSCLSPMAMAGNKTSYRREKMNRGWQEDRNPERARKLLVGDSKKD
ncbi:hypothetical protein Hanom_Chr01g00047201 [Helianthus anomalus]